MAYATGILNLTGVRPSWKFLQEKQSYLATFFLDICALIAAYRIALPVSAYLRELLQTAPSGNFYPSTEMRQVVYFCLSLGILFFLLLNGHYSIRVPWWSQVQHITKVIIFSVLVDGITSYALELYYSRIFIATNWGIAFALILLGRLFMNKVKSLSSSWKRSTAIIADSATATDALYALASDSAMGLDVKSILLNGDNKENVPDREELPEAYKKVDIIRNADYDTFILNNSDLYYLVSLETLPENRREHLVKLFNRNGILYSLIPAMSRTTTYQCDPQYFFGSDIMLLNTRYPFMPLSGRFLKRAMDIGGASVALMVFFLPMLVIATMLKLDGQSGSPLYAGIRVGQNGRRFRCWKFRTMEPGTDHLLHRYLAENPKAKAHWDRYFKIPDDPRVQSRTARFIRKASMDELPQLWNVLCGEMSLVGPRPILENEIASYGEKFEEYTSVKPGITGLWQTSGRNGTSFQRRVTWDSWYVRNWSLWGDFIIILKTFQVVINRSGAS